MNNEKFCTHCGAMNQINSQYCTNCGMQINQNHVHSNMNNCNCLNEQSNTNSSDGTKLGIISLVTYFCSPVIVGTIVSVLPTSIRDEFSSLGALCPLAGIITMIIGRVKYPNNKLLKVVMWVIIVSIILSVFAFVLFLIWCHVTCMQIDASGCS